MSSRIVSPADAARVKPIDWRRVISGPDIAAPASGFAPSPGDDPQYADAEHVWRDRLQQAEVEWRRRAEQEYHRGLSEGEAAGARKAAEKVDRALEKMARSVADLASCRDRFRREAEQDVVMIAIAVARRVLRREVTVDQEAILGLVKVAMEKVNLREVHQVRVHAGDVDALRKHLERIGAPAAIRVEVDPGIERGGMIFETARGNLDVSIETQLRQIERGFTDLAGGGK